MRAIWACVLAFWVVGGGSARAEESAARWVVARGLSGDEIARIAQELASDDRARRMAAVTALTSLHEESLPGIATRLQQLARQRPERDDAVAAMTAFRHAVGSRRADDEVDVAPGVPVALAESRSPARLAMAEPLLLLRSLERMRDPAAGERIAEIFLLDEPGVWGHEAGMLRVRGGLSLLPTLIRLRSHAESRIRKWAQSAVSALGMDDPKDATSLEDPELAARVVLALSDPLDFPAMPVLVRLVDNPSLQVRAAAREAVARFGKNAIWQLRELYQEVAGEPASKSWNAEQTASRLYAALDAERDAVAQRLLEQGMAAFVGGDLQTMQTRYDTLLARFPDYAQRAKLAPGYAALGEARLADDDLEGARDAFARAVRLDPSHAAAASWRGQAAFAAAERTLTRGVVDLPGYERALQQAPELSAAQQIHDRLTGELAARERQRRRIAAGGAIALLLGFVLLALRPRREVASAP